MVEVTVILLIGGAIGFATGALLFTSEPGKNQDAE